jgi:hypothetical protein
LWSSPRSSTRPPWCSPQASGPIGSSGGRTTKLAGPHLPASLKQLEKAVAAANKHAEEVQHAQRAPTTREAAAGTGAPVADAQLSGELAGEDLDDDVDVEHDGALREAASPPADALGSWP